MCHLLETVTHLINMNYKGIPIYPVKIANGMILVKDKAGREYWLYVSEIDNYNENWKK